MFFKKKRDPSEILSILESYLKNEINYLPEVDYSKYKIDDKNKQKLESIFNILNKKQDEELLIYGELLLVTEKTSHGNLNDRIHHLNTSNYQLNYIAKSVNSLKESFSNSPSLLESSSNLSSCPSISIKPKKLIFACDGNTVLLLTDASNPNQSFGTSWWVSP